MSREQVAKPARQDLAVARRLEDLSLRGFLRFVVRRQGVIAAFALLLAAASAAGFFLATPKYSATAILMITPQNQAPALAQSARPAASSRESTLAFMQSQVELIQSPGTITQIVDQLKLDRDPYWNASLRAPDALTPVRNAFESWGLSSPPTSAAEIRDDIETKVASALRVRRKGQSYVVHVSAVSARGAQAAQIANAVTALYAERQMQSQFMAPGQTLNDYVRGRESAMRMAENALSTFRASLGKDDGSLAPDPLLAASAAAVARSPDWAAAQADMAAREARYRQAQAFADKGFSQTVALPEALYTDALRTLITSQKQALDRETALKQQFGETDPAVEKARLERIAFGARINSELDRIAAAAKAERDLAQSRLQSLQTAGAVAHPVQQAVSAAAESPHLEQLKKLEDEAVNARMAYESAVRAASEGRAAAIRPANVVEVSKAMARARPAWPRIGPWVTATLAFAGLFGLLAGMIVDALDGSLGGSEEAARKTGRTILASTPLLGAKQLKQLPPQDRHPAGYVVEKPMSAFAEGLRTLRAVVLYTVREQETKLLCITSALAREGKTATALSLARIAALAGQKVLLIDAGAGKESTSHLLGLETSAAKYDGRTGDWRASLVQDPETRLDVLPVAARIFMPNEVWGGKDSALRELRASYDLIILDAPSVLAGTDARTIARACDQTILVARAGKTKARSVKAAATALENEGVFVPGLLLNSVDARARGRLSFEDSAYQGQIAQNYLA